MNRGELAKERSNQNRSIEMWVLKESIEMLTTLGNHILAKDLHIPWALLPGVHNQVWKLIKLANVIDTFDQV